MNDIYRKAGKLRAELMGRGIAWLDTGTPQSMKNAGKCVQTIQSRQGLMIGCPEEVAYRAGLITAEQVVKLADPLKKNHYGQYLIELVEKGPL